MGLYYRRNSDFSGCFCAINAKTLQVEFNTAVDTTKAVVTVKKGSVAVNASDITWSEDKTSAEIELASKLFEGEYTVSVAGLTEEALTGSVEVKNEMVSSIELLSETAPVVVTTEGGTVSMKEAVAAYRVFNQYGEDITTSPLATSIAWTASNGVAVEDNNKGALLLTKGVDFKVGDKVAVTGINSATNTVVSGTLTISDAAVTQSVEFGGLYHADGEELTSAADIAEFALLVSAKDQYGNDLGADEINEDVVFTSSNEALLSVVEAVDGQGADEDQVGLSLEFGPNAALGGKVTITAISKATGKVTSYEVTVKAAATLDTLSLSAPAEVVAAGDTVKLPFIAADQYGNALTKFKALDGKVSFSTTDGVEPVLKADVNGNAYIEYKPTTKGNKVIIVTTSAGKVSQLNLEVKEAATPVTIESLKDVSKTIAVDGSVDIKLKNVVVKDQYGRAFSLTDKLDSEVDGKYRVVATDVDGNNVVSITSDELTANDGVITIEGDVKGTENVTLTLEKYVVDAYVPVATSPLTTKFTVSDKTAFNSYELATIDTVHADTEEDTYTRELKVYGITESGEKVLIPAANYTVTTSGDLLTYDAATGELEVAATEAELTAAFGTKTEITSKVTIVVDGASAPVTLTQDVKLSTVAPKADTVELDSDLVTDGVATVSTVTLASDNDVAALAGVLEITDQYGEAYEVPATTKVTVTNLVDADKEGELEVAANTNGTIATNIAGAELDDTFVATFYVEGKTVSVKFKVVNPAE